MRKPIKFLLYSMFIALTLSNGYSMEAQNQVEENFSDFQVYDFFKYNPEHITINKYQYNDNGTLSEQDQQNLKKYIQYLKNFRRSGRQNTEYLKEKGIISGNEESKEDYKTTYDKFTYSFKYIIKQIPDDSKDNSVKNEYILKNYDLFAAKNYTTVQIHKLIDQLLLDTLYFSNNYSTRMENDQNAINNSCKLFNLAWGTLLKYTSTKQEMSDLNNKIKAFNMPLKWIGVKPVK